MDWTSLIRPELESMRPYAPGLRASEVRTRSGHDDVYKLSSNENPYGPFPNALMGMRAVLGRLNVYPDGGTRALRRRLSEHLGVADSHIVVSNGSNELLRVIAQCVLGPGDECVFAWPSFVVYPMVTQLMGAVAVKAPLAEGEVHDLDAMVEACTARTKLMFLCNPNNPTGTTYDKAAFESFLAKVPEHVLVIVDEAYFEYVTDADFPDGLAYFDGERPLGVLRTFSKIYSLAGARVGYGVLPEPLLAAVNKVREPFNVNTVAQVGAYYSLGEDDEVVRRRVENQEQRAALYACFDRLGVDYVPSQTNFVYMHTTKPIDVFEALLGEGIIVRDLSTAPALRVGIGTPEHTRITIAAFEAAVAKLGTL